MKAKQSFQSMLAPWAMCSALACNSELVFPGPAGQTGGSANPSPSAGPTPAPTADCRISGCIIGTQACHPVSHTCVECVTDAQCTSSAFPHCNPAWGRCVQCVATADCGAGQACVTETGRCAATCAEDANCAAVDPKCDKTRGICVECQANDPCDDTPSTPHCVANTTCSVCAVDADCAVPTPYCDIFRSRCVACQEQTECPAGTACDVALGVCKTSG